MNTAKIRNRYDADETRGIGAILHRLTKSATRGFRKVAEGASEGSLSLRFPTYPLQMGSTVGPPTSGAYTLGAYYTDSTGKFWQCTKAGTGTGATWKQIRLREWYVDDYMWAAGGATDDATDMYNAWMACLWDWYSAGAAGVIHGPTGGKGSYVSGQLYVPNDAIIRTTPGSLTDWTYSWNSSVALTSPYVSAHSSGSITFVATGHRLSVGNQVSVTQSGGAAGYSGAAAGLGYFVVTAVPDANHVTVAVSQDPGATLPTSGTITPLPSHPPLVIDLGGAGTVGHEESDIRSGALIDGRFDGSANLFQNDYACGGLTITGKGTQTITVTSPPAGQYAYFGNNASGGAATVIPAGSYSLSTTAAPISSAAGTWGLYISADGTLMVQANTPQSECLVGDTSSSFPVNGGHGQTLRIASIKTDANGYAQILTDDQSRLGIIEDRGHGRTLIQRGAIGCLDATRTVDGVVCLYHLNGNVATDRITWIGAVPPTAKQPATKDAIRFGGMTNLGTAQAAASVLFGYQAEYRNNVFTNIRTGIELCAISNSTQIENPVCHVGGGSHFIDNKGGIAVQIERGFIESQEYDTIVRIAANETHISGLKAYDEDLLAINTAITGGATTSVTANAGPTQTGNISAFIGVTSDSLVPGATTYYQGKRVRLGQGTSADPYEVVNISAIAGTALANNPTIASYVVLADQQHTVLNLTSNTGDPASGIAVNDPLFFGATSATQEGGKVSAIGTVSGSGPFTNWVVVRDRIVNNHTGDAVTGKGFTLTFNPAPVLTHPNGTHVSRHIGPKIESGSTLNRVYVSNSNPFTWWDKTSQNDVIQPGNTVQTDIAQTITAKKTFGDGATVAPSINHAPTAGTGFGPPVSGTWVVGDVFTDQYGTDWVCQVAGAASTGAAKFARRGFPQERVQCVVQTATGASGMNYTLPAPGAGLVNRIINATWAVYGSGAMPSTATPMVITVTDDPSGANTQAFVQPVTAAQQTSNLSLPIFPAGSWAGTVNKSTGFTSTAPGTNVTLVLVIFYEVGPPRATDLKGKSQTSTANADNTFSIAAPGAGLYNIIHYASFGIVGTGGASTALSASAPVTATIKDGSSGGTLMVQFVMTALTAIANLVPAPSNLGGGIAGTANTQTTVDVPAAGNNNVSYLNVFYRQA